LVTEPRSSRNQLQHPEVLPIQANVCVGRKTAGILGSLRFIRDSGSPFPQGLKPALLLVDDIRAEARTLHSPRG
jgi:hypothetical protein